MPLLCLSSYVHLPFSFLLVVPMHPGPFNVFISGSTGTDYYPSGDASRFYPQVSINLVNRASSSRSGRELRSRGAGKRWSMAAKEIIAFFFDIFFALNLIRAYFDSWHVVISMLPAFLVLPSDYFHEHRYHRTVGKRIHVSYEIKYNTILHRNCCASENSRISASRFVSSQIFNNIRIWKMNYDFVEGGDRTGRYKRIV